MFDHSHPQPHRRARRHRWQATVAAVSAALLLALPGAAAGDPVVNDTSVGAAIRDELAEEPSVPLAKLVVTADDGVVTLAGTVDNLLARERATRVAETVKGVRTVINRIRVEPAARHDDSDLHGKVEFKLASDAATDSYQIVTSVSDGEVSLRGAVDNWAEKQLAGRIAMSVAGVTGVDNRLRVTGGVGDMNDWQFREQVRDRLHWDALVDANLVDVQVKDAEVTLSGIVGSAAERERAITDAWVAGIRAVHADELEVARWARDEDLRDTASVELGDTGIADAITRALHLDPRVDATRVEVSVAGGEVTLDGQVPDLRSRRAAASDARNTLGVTAVDNQLLVVPAATHSDVAIEGDILAALATNPFVESYLLKVDVSDGVATLSGTADSRFEKAEADNAAAQVPGVIDVHNRIELVDDSRLILDPYVADDLFTDEMVWVDSVVDGGAITGIDDDALHAEVRDELFWSPFVDSENVDVDVNGGVVTLDGEVGSIGERDAALHNAWEGGAISVRDQLEIVGG